MQRDIMLKPIGYVKVGMPVDSSVRWNRWSEISVIEISDEYVEGLKGLEEFSHIFVIYFMHRAAWRPEDIILKPRRREDLPEVGVFAFRGRNRPNPIGLAVCEVAEIKYNLLKVRGLDAYPDSPILDLKPYDYYDIVKNPRVPSWFLKLWEEGGEARPTWVGP